MSDLDDALADYATYRSADLARAIEVLGRAALAGFSPPKPRTNALFHAAWLELARTAAARSWCLDTLLDKLPPDKHDTLCERLAVLASVPPDPRIARSLTAARLSGVPVIAWVEAHIPPVIERHAEAATSSVPASVAARWSGVRPPAQRAPTALYAAVYAAPDDDGARAVLADALQDAGDPRGELIALQLQEHAGTATSELRDRAQALIQEHGKAWLGPLRPIVYRATMRRGFLSRIELAGAWSAPAETWAQLAHEPMLATVEDLVKSQATGAVYATVLAGIARTVRSIHVFDDVVWDVVTSTPMPRLRSLIVAGWRRKQDAAMVRDRVAPWLASHPEVIRFGCEQATLESLPAMFLERFEELAITLGDLAGAIALWTRFPRVRVVSVGSVELHRADVPFARVISDRQGMGSPDLTGLPEEIRCIEVVNDAKLARQLAAEYPGLIVRATRSRSGALTGLK